MSQKKNVTYMCQNVIAMYKRQNKMAFVLYFWESHLAKIIDTFSDEMMELNWALKKKHKATFELIKDKSGHIIASFTHILI